MTQIQLDRSTSGVRSRQWIVVGLFVLSTLVGVGVVSPSVLIGLMFDGLAASLVLLPPMLAGLWLLPLFRLGPMPLRWHLLLGAALGVGVLSILVLLCGLSGILHRPVWIGLLAVLTVVGYGRVRALSAKSGLPSPREGGETGSFVYLWLVAVPFLIFAIVAASNAPGFIWAEEGFGYDVLEYHLQLPKEYLENGHIQYLSHNVYANLPANVEMLYLLAMIVLDDVYDVGTTTNMIHLILGAMTVGAAWVAGRQYSPRAGVVCGVVTAITGWISYLCGLSYVENGMLFFAMTATAAILRFGQSSNVSGWAAIAGATAGFACGCKATALPMIALPLAIIIALSSKSSTKKRRKHLAVFTLATIVTFSPWLIKNQVMTGSPVFPLLNDFFKAKPPGWGAEETAAWNRGHAPPEPTPDNPSPRLRSTQQLLITDTYQRFGPAILVVGLFGLIGRRRDRVDLLLIGMIGVQLGVWLFMTHLLLRFAVVLLIPFAILCARAVGDGGAAWRHRTIVALLVAGCTWNAVWAAQLHKADQSTYGAPASLIYEGELLGFEYLQVVNRELPEDARILLLGDAKAFYYQREVDYCVAFNRNPFLELIASGATDEEVMRWLMDHEYSHVLVHWSEVRRLARTYGFSPPVDTATLERRMRGLESVGLTTLQEFRYDGVTGRYVTLYAIPQ